MIWRVIDVFFRRACACASRAPFQALHRLGGCWTFPTDYSAAPTPARKYSHPGSAGGASNAHCSAVLASVSMHRRSGFMQQLLCERPSLRRQQSVDRRFYEPAGASTPGGRCRCEAQQALCLAMPHPPRAAAAGAVGCRVR